MIELARISMVFKAITRIIKFVIGLGLLVLLLPRLITAFSSLTQTYSIESAPSNPVAIVFGAGLWRDGTPTSVLRDRIEAAAELFFSGKVEKILMSGDNRFDNYNEPKAMRDYAVSLGVPDTAIVLDYAGRRTYDTCYRTLAIFGIKQATLVTQSFHLPRALYTCNALGIKAVGIASDLRQYRKVSLLYWNMREIPATLTALIDVHLVRPQPVLGEPEPIFPTLNQ